MPRAQLDWTEYPALWTVSGVCSAVETNSLKLSVKDGLMRTMIVDVRDDPMGAVLFMLPISMPP